MDKPTLIWSPARVAGRAVRFVFALVIGALTVSVLVAARRLHDVRAAEREARLLVQAFQFEAADALLGGREPWARCFPGYFKESALLRIRSRVRLRLMPDAWTLAETVRLHREQPVAFPPPARLGERPAAWLHQFGIALVSQVSKTLAPPRNLNAWAGYEAILNELSALGDDAALDAFQAEVNTRFPRSPIAILANATPRQYDALPRSRRPAPPASANTPAARTRIRPEGLEDEEPARQARNPPEPGGSAAWAIVTNQETYAYQPRSAAPVRPLKAGDVVAIEEFTSIRGVDVAVGSLITASNHVPELAFLLRDLQLHNGFYNDAHPREVLWRSRLAEIEAAEAAGRAQFAREGANRKPEEAAYLEAAGRYEALQKEAQSLNARLERGDPDRSRILERLRAIKYQEAGLFREVQARKAAFDRVGGNAARERLENDLRQWDQEKKQLLQNLSGLSS